MDATPRHPDAARRSLPDVIIDAARRLAISHGWGRVRMGQVAVAAGVSRQTVYNEFATKTGLAEALAAREVERFVTDVRTHLFAHGADAHAAANAAIAHVLTEAAVNPLLKAILTSARGEADPLLPFLTTRADVVLVAATGAIQDWARSHFPGIDPEELAFGAESIVRLVVSHIMLPLTPAEETARRLADLAAYFVGKSRASPGPA
ncbi:TetR family transcriptional regulator [Actinoplanes sp. ATCC 53533]|uniref:TetR/AcrR family transcriptional regulator n=1 Tax=Actinoplanes sp. ATCC 53533 TaxID=1288362 RepID=UPI000F77AEB9|nr:TetR family transcriptional regulator [Actinoplanes sp. ATCC 53533]RSM69455.1 TetR family transcriptional regulator [Actinoplanes sp. ATCC 53533]